MLLHIIGYFLLGLFLKPWPWGLAISAIVTFASGIAMFPSQYGDRFRRWPTRTLVIFVGGGLFAIGVDMAAMLLGGWARSLF